jgi:hypothetical protein
LRADSVRETLPALAINPQIKLKRVVRAREHKPEKDPKTDGLQLEPNRVAKNILEFLKSDPRAYRSFGVWWWSVKTFLRQFYGRDDLYCLGSYVDTAQAAELPKLPIELMLARALEEHQLNTRFNAHSNHVENLDGELVTIWDDDAGL